MTAVHTEPLVRRSFTVRGVVQGVGFRPFVARLAADLGLAGQCANGATRVVAEVEGPAGAVDEFERRLRTEAPPMAVIIDVQRQDVSPTGAHAFRIESSLTEPGERTLVAPDTATCEDCLREMRDPEDRRYRHPFITCTNCGPRLTIITDLPYDRPRTTMAGFPMCARCADEYSDPADRRYHAQPIACPDCGPTLRAVGPDGSILATGTEPSLDVARKALRAGRIVAVKGIGGYHLACDASDAAAVAALRERKHRPRQPFAVMARDLATAKVLGVVGEAERALLSSPARPIVLLDKAPGLVAHVADAVAPGLLEVGVMLPYAPVHHLLLDEATPVLVMTSGNVSGEPLCFDDDDALARLGRIADLFLAHDRPIHVPCEDSVMAVADGLPLPVRRSRGYAPLPVALPTDDRVVLAAGAELKNTSALTRGGLAFVSAHVGDLGTLESRSAHERTVEQLVRFHDRQPSLVVADLHPGYASRAWAESWATEHGLPLVEVQHHHAHLAALAAEHGRLGEPLVGVVFDGTGYGCDRTVWGGEILALSDDGATARRLAHVDPFPLPGGDAAVRSPIRVAAAFLLSQGLPLDAAPEVASCLTPEERAALPGLVASSPVVTSSAGRLFDVVSALLGVRDRITYEGQAAIELEVLATTWERSAASRVDTDAPRLSLPVDATRRPLRLRTAALLDGLLAGLTAGVDRGALAWAFHEALATASVHAAGAACRETGTATVGLTGGVWQNRLLLRRARLHLERAGLEPLTHRLVPPNDGGIALGQAAVGLATLARG